MGWLEDSVEEFRKLPPAGKVAVGVAAVGVGVLALVTLKNNQGGASASGAVTGAFPGGTGATTVTDPAGGTWTIPPAPAPVAHPVTPVWGPNPPTLHPVALGTAGGYYTPLASVKTVG